MHEKKPWLKFYGQIPEHIDYPRVTMYEALMQTVSRSPDAVAYDFFGYTPTYRQFSVEIDRCADALAALGLKQGDRITISMPTCPREIEFRKDLPCTLVGKVAFNTLEQEEIAKLKAEGKYCGE